MEFFIDNIFLDKESTPPIYAWQNECVNIAKLKTSTLPFSIAKDLDHSPASYFKDETH